MGLWAIIPVKPLRRGRSRLSGVLTEDERTALNYLLLKNTLEVLKQIPEMESVLVVSRDPSALVLAREYGARTVQEDGSPELNLALRRATIMAEAYSARQVIIVPADLPLITVEDIRVILNEGKQPPFIVIAPDRHYQGTNVMYISPPGLIDYLYGPGSYLLHRMQAEKFGYRLSIVVRPALQLDLDLPEDLEILKNIK